MFLWQRLILDLPRVAVAVVGAGALSAGATAYGASEAADAQTDAANQANQTQRDQYAQTRADLAPYRDLGAVGTNALTSRIGELTSPIQMDQATLEQTPGYQFNLTQGLKAVQNSAAARGLGASGAAQKGAASYATGLADSTYQNQFNNANTNQTNAYNRLMGLVSSGQSAAAGTVAANQQTTNAINSNTIGAGNAQAAADNTIGKAVGSSANSIGGFYASPYGQSNYNGLYGSTGTGW